MNRRGMSLRRRLIILSSLLMLAGMLLGLGYQVIQARNRVSDELVSATDLAWHLLDAMLPMESGNLEPTARDTMQNRLHTIEAVRHLDIRIIGASEQVLMLGALPAGRAAPDWFVRLVQVPEVERRHPLAAGSNETVVIRSNAAAEISEAWQDSKDFLVVLLLLLLGINGILYVTIGYWLAPVQLIVDSLTYAEQGDFTGQLPVASLPELRTITDKVNKLKAVLLSSKADNERLALMSLQIQEAERRNLANELHDEMGQSLSAIKAIAWSLQEQTKNRESTLEVGAEKIFAIATAMSGQVRTMLGRLRPALLDELGLVAAVRQMVREWNDNHSGCKCELTVAPAFSEVPLEQQIHVYRILQEALTNIATHANAKRAEVVMQAGESFQIVISDDGNGFDPHLQKLGRGISGMVDRCQALGGQLSLFSRPGLGVRLSMVFLRVRDKKGDI
jgi:two-component system sensor histidine kinase UhpB